MWESSHWVTPGLAPECSNPSLFLDYIFFLLLSSTWILSDSFPGVQGICKTSFGKIWQIVIFLNHVFVFDIVPLEVQSGCFEDIEINLLRCKHGEQEKYPWLREGVSVPRVSDSTCTWKTRDILKVSCVFISQTCRNPHPYSNRKGFWHFENNNT